MARFTHLTKSVQVPLEFIENLMPRANPTYVMVYLCGLGLCGEKNLEFSNSDIAKKLDILESDVVKAWKYWEKVGAVSFDKDFHNIEFSSVISQSPKNEPAKKKTPVEEKLINKEVSQMLLTAEKMLKKPLSRREMNSLYSFYYDYSFSCDVILVLLEYCISEDKTNISYIEKIASLWADDGINTVTSADSFVSKRQKERSMRNKLRKSFGIDRDFSDSEKKYIATWTTEFSMSESMIKKAYEITVLNTGKIAFPYINKILKSWFEQGIKTVSKIPEKKASAVSGNYDFDEIEKKEHERLFKKGGSN